MKRVTILALLTCCSALTMEKPEHFAERKKYIIYYPGIPTPQAMQALEQIKADPEARLHTIITGSAHADKGIFASNCCKYLSNELLLMAPALATTACCLCTTNNVTCGQGLAAGCGGYIFTVLCLSDENESLSRETYSGKAALYLKRRIKEKAVTIFPCLASKKLPSKDE